MTEPAGSAPEPAPAPGLRRRTLTGIGWTTGSRVLRRVFHFGVTAVLAHLLTPTEFGLVAMVVVFTNFVGLFTEAGFRNALVQRPEVTGDHLSSVFWLNLAVGFGLFALAVAAGPWVADFYGEPVLAPLTALIGVNFLIGAFPVVHLALVQREMDFRALGIVEIVATVVAGGLAIGMALAGFGVWSLAAQLVAYTFVHAGGLWVVGDWRPSLRFVPAAVRDLLSYSANLLGFNVFNYWVRTADDLLVGKFVGSAGLGIYTRAYAAMLLPTGEISGIVGQVMFPALSRIQDDVDRVKAVYLRASRVIGLLTIPAVCGLFVVARPFVLAVFGPGWEPVVPVLQVLCLVGVKQPVGSTVGWLYQSQGRTDLQFRWGLVSGLVTLAAFGIGVIWGVMGVAVAYTVRSYLLWYPSIEIPGRLVGLSFGEFVGNVASVFGVSVVMAGATWGVGALLPGPWGAWPTLGVQVAAGVAVFGALVRLLDLRAYREFVSLARELVAGPGSPPSAGSGTEGPR